jgi:hypothetical protein
MKNLSRHTDLRCKLGSSLLTRGIQMGEMSKLSSLIELVKHVIWAVSLYFLFLLLHSISRISKYRKYKADDEKSEITQSSVTIRMKFRVLIHCVRYAVGHERASFLFFRVPSASIDNIFK